MNRDDSLFCLRYAVRVLERNARLWHRLDALLRVLAIFSGTAALGALMAQSATWTLAGGLTFAFLQALEFGLTPTRREQEARGACALYTELLARQHTLDDAQLAAGYWAAVASDQVIVPEFLRRLAYNDVLEERGLDPAEKYPLSRVESVVGFFA